MKKVFCTIISKDYLPYARTLFQSILKYDNNVDCVALVVDRFEFSSLEGFYVLKINELCERELVERINAKYSNKSDALRWSLKSVLMIHLLKTLKFDQVFYVDCDIMFFSDFSFLYDELGINSFLLSPQWNSLSPNLDENGFLINFSEGIFNAGFLGATINGIGTLKKLANMCLYSADRIVDKPLYADQSYFQLIPLLSPDSKILFHRGCNLAVWNIQECRRIVSENGEILINGVFPVVFIHFSNPFEFFLKDKLLVSYLESYSIALVGNGSTNSIIDLAKNYFVRHSHKDLTISQRIRRKILLAFRKIHFVFL